MKKSFNKQSLIYTLLAVFFWSTVATAFKLTLAGMNYVQLLFYASLTSTIVLFLIISLSNQASFITVFTKNSIKKSLLLGLLNPFLYYMILFKAYSLLPAQEAQPLNYTWPITISILSVLVLKQKITSTSIIGLLSAFIGVVIIATRGDFTSLQFDNALGVSLALGSSIVWAFFWIMNLLDQRNNAEKLFGVFFLGTIYSAIYIFYFDSFNLGNLNYLFGAGYIGIFEMGITFFLWNKGLELSTDRIKTSTLAYLSPFLSLIFIAFILEETIRASSVIGLFFIIGGILYQNLKLKKGE
ncbi:MAG: DMT family transporter [Bacteroidota bacterium]